MSGGSMPASRPAPKGGMLRGLLSFGGMTMLSRVFGLIRDICFSSAFGSNWMTDAFWVAFRIPNFMRRLFAEGSFSTAFVPVFTEIKEKRSHEDLKTLVSRTAGTLGGVLLVVVALGIFFAPALADQFSKSGTAASAEHSALTITMLRVTFPFLLFVSLTALAGGALNSFQRFGMPALTPIILNLCMIAGALWGSRFVHPPILAMAWAILIAGALQLLFQLPQMAQLDLLAMPRWGWNHPDVRRVMTLMVPTLLGSSVAQINLLFDTFIAAKLATGSQTWLSAADRFLEFPLGVFGIALGTVILPTLSRHHVNTDHDGFSKSLDWGLRTTLMIILPAMLGLMMLSFELVATMYQHGKFTAGDAEMAALSVFGLSFGLPAFALVKTVLPAFYARQDTRTPVRAGLVAVVANMVFNVAILAILYVYCVPESYRAQHGLMDGLAGWRGLHFALGLASALSSYLNLGLLWYWLRKAGVYDMQPGWGRFLMKLLVANGAMALALYFGRQWTPHFGGIDTWTRIGWLAALVCGGAAVYFAAMVALGFRIRHLREH